MIRQNEYPIEGEVEAEINQTHLPPAISVQIILLNDFYPISNLERDLVWIFWGKVVQGIDVFRHLCLR